MNIKDTRVRLKELRDIIQRAQIHDHETVRNVLEELLGITAECVLEIGYLQGITSKP